MNEQIEIREDVLCGLITVHAELELMKGPGQRFSVEPFAEGTYRVMDYLSRKCVAMAPTADWAIVIAERLNDKQVHIRED